MRKFLACLGFQVCQWNRRNDMGGLSKTVATEGKRMAKKYRMLISIEGTFHGLPSVKRGDIVELDDASAKRYLASGYIETETSPKVPVGHPYQPSAHHMTQTSGLRKVLEGWH